VIRPGARADLLLLDANPLEDVANTTRIHGVLVNGRWLGPEERTRMLAALSSTP
jgi:imidazolonepropionase-like amidohydrolase